jgi:ribulose 1,5-bisphosphate synthetase/thiazole synthase
VNDSVSDPTFKQYQKTSRAVLVVFPEDDLKMTRTVKLAVVGSGLAGLTAAHLLKRPLENISADIEFEVHLFEKVRFS